jgi:hypothetical protein
MIVKALRKIAILGLLSGWYLLLPPWVAYNTFDADAPISKWQQSASYDTATECRQDQYALIQYYRTHPKAEDADWHLRVYLNSRRVATDDPRLAR